MTAEPPLLATIGFGEAAKAFVRGFGPDAVPRVRAFDYLTEREEMREAKRADYTAAGVAGFDTLGEALDGASVVLSLVTPDETVKAARAAAEVIAPGTLYCDMTSAAPGTKREAAAAIEGAGARYVDVAVMSPVNKLLNKVPLKGSGPHAGEARDALGQWGFDLDVVEGEVGKASAIKMIRSVIVKGLEALTTEWLLAAEAVGVTDDVVHSLESKWPGIDWAEKGDYNLGRMILHGRRRAAELDEVVKTLDELGVPSSMSAGARAWHARVGARGHAMPDGLHAKLQLVREGEALAA